jgi:hypothetical protein
LKQLTFIFFFCLCFFSQESLAQQAIIGSWEDDSLRVAQLAGQFNPTVSFAVRPIEIEPVKISWKKPIIRALPLTLITQFNSTKPFGWNDGAMIPANGLQVMGRIGLYARYGIIEVQ